eukprot:1432419-Prymnesium_polylepis.1
MVMTRFDATPVFGKSYISLVDLKTKSVENIATAIECAAHSAQTPGGRLRGPLRPCARGSLLLRRSWPNVPTTLNASVFGFTVVVVGSGFLVPSHTTGG